MPDALQYQRRTAETSVLYRVVQQNLEPFLAFARDRPVPRFVERELRAFLECGILAHGFVRVHCDACGRDRLVAFSCYLELKTIRSRERRSLDSRALARAALRIVSHQKARR